ncbi:MADCA protein, partial [Nothocercus nigrocapillus]|nr:MADCA protein [Nothocercus nigrocapillus]
MVLVATATSSLRTGRPSGPAPRLSVEPLEPLVPLGGSALLNCSLGCPVGTVQWRGLDTNLGSVISSGGHSVLRVTDAAVATEGTRICQGTCGRQHFQQVVELRVYSLPQALQLSAEPAVLMPGQPATLHCAAQRVYPPVGLALTWYRGQQLLQRADIEVEETEEGLFDVQDTLVLPAHEVAAGNEIWCQLTLTVRQETFTRVAAVAVRNAGERRGGSTWLQSLPQGQTGMGRRVPSTGSPREQCGGSVLAVTEQPMTTSPELPSTALVTTGSPSTATWTAPTQSTVATTAQAMLPRDPAPETTRAWAAATGIPSAQSTAAQAGSTATLSTAPSCSLRVWSLPPNGTQGQALRIECRAHCGGRDVPVRWLRAPVALSQYGQEAAGVGAALSVERAELQHQGRYECIALGHAVPVGSLQLALSPDPLGTNPDIVVGTTVSLLGLIVSAVTSRCLWRRLKSRYDLS